MKQDLIIQRKDTLQYNQGVCGVLADLTNPLKTYFDIDLFVRGNIFLNSKEEASGYNVIATNFDFLDSYMHGFDDDLAGKPFLKAIQETSCDSYCYLPWSSADSCPLSQLLSQKFRLSKGLFIYKRCKGYLEAWWFVGKESSKIPSAVTKFSLSPFLDFMCYFEVKNLLVSPFMEYNHLFDASHKSDLDKIDSFKASISSNRFALNLRERSISLSKREWECLSQVAHGKTHKEIANILAISPRTVESYMNNIKDRTGVLYKSELVTLFHKNNAPSF